MLVEFFYWIDVLTVFIVLLVALVTIVLFEEFDFIKPSIIIWVRFVPFDFVLLADVVF